MGLASLRALMEFMIDRAVRETRTHYNMKGLLVVPLRDELGVGFSGNGDEERRRRASEGPEIGGGPGGTSDADPAADEAAKSAELSRTRE